MDWRKNQGGGTREWEGESSRCIVVAEEAGAGVETALDYYSRPLAAVPSFNYLGRVLSSSNNDFLVVLHNINKAWIMCAWLSRVLGR